MDWKLILNNIWEAIGIPVVVSILGILSYIGTKIVKQIKGIIAAKVELVAISSENQIRQQVYGILDSTVEAAVASNMQLAKKLKERNNGKLEMDDITELQNSCKRLVEQSLPSSLLNENSSTLEILGGKEKINSMISTLIEKHVFGYHNKK